MESEKKQGLKSVIEYFVIAAIAIQAVFAAFWLFKNIGFFQSDYVAHTYILAAESLKVDDSMGILYALIVRVLGHGAVLQVFQFLAVSAAILFFSISLFEKKAGIILSLLMVFNPIILQAEMAVSPNALVLGCGLAVIASVVKIRENKRWTVSVFAFSLAAGFMNPDYAYIFFAVETIYFLVTGFARKKFELFLALACIIAFIVPVTVNGAIRDDYAYGRVQRSVQFLSMQRTAWPRMHEYAEALTVYEMKFLGEKSGTDYTILTREADKIPGNVSSGFAYTFEMNVGKKAATGVYSDLTKRAIAKGFGYWGSEAIRDEALYFFSPVAAEVIYLRRESDTSVPIALDSLFGRASKTSRLFFLFSLTASFVFSLLYAVKGICERKTERRTSGVPFAASLLGIIVLISLYATLVCVREYDYRNVLFLVIGWPAAAMALTERKRTI